MADESMSELINEYDNIKYSSKPAKKMRKKISKVLVLNEMEQRMAGGFRTDLKAALEFIKSETPIGNISDVKDESVSEKNIDKILNKVQNLGFFLFALLFSLPKMGYNASKLVVWMLQKPEIIERLKQEGLYDSIIEYAKSDKEKYKDLNDQEYLDHLFGKEPYRYNDLMDEMSDKINGKGRAA